jgi:integrase
MKYWLNELATHDPATVKNYQRYFEEFLAYLNTDADKLLTQRMEHLKHDDIKVQRTIESYFLQFLRDLKEAKGYENGTLQVVFAAIRSFFELHYCPLRTRKKDYPKNTPNGVRRASKEHIVKVLEGYKPTNKPQFYALLMAFKDTGLRVIDVMKLNCDVILENWDKEIIPLTVRTEKTGYLAKTFLGTDAVKALKEYIEARRKGTRKIAPENVTKNSPLFRTVTKGNLKRMKRMNASNIIIQAFQKVGEKQMSAHSLRKGLQTALEKGGMPTNWIDQVLGHELINSRDAYSLPTDEELQEAYLKAYKTQIQIAPTIERIQPPKAEERKVVEAKTMEEVKEYLMKGYNLQGTVCGIHLLTK